MKKYLLVLIFMSLNIMVQAQTNFGFVEATIVKKRGDTLVCLIERAISYVDEINYKYTEDGSQNKMQTKDIMSIRTPFAYYQNIQLDKKEKLMNLVIEGKSSLYSYIIAREGEAQKSSSVTLTSFKLITHYVVKIDGKYQEIEKKHFKETLSQLLFDCPNILKQINDGTYQFHDMKKIIDEYNNCLSQ